MGGHEAVLQARGVRGVVVSMLATHVSGPGSIPGKKERLIYLLHIGGCPPRGSDIT